MRASRSKVFLHFAAAGKDLVVSVCLPCRRIVAAAPLTLLTRIEQEHIGTARSHPPVVPGDSKPKHKM